MKHSAIWKYQLVPYEATHLAKALVPSKSKLLSLLPLTQESSPTVYFRVDPREPLNKTVSFTVLPTGDQAQGALPVKSPFIGTCVDPVQDLVWHVYLMNPEVLR